MARAGLDLVLPKRAWPNDATVDDVVASRFGRQVAERLVDPLLAGIHAGHSSQLSAAATAPQLLNAVRASRSLLLGLRRMERATSRPEAGSVFVAPKQGMQALPERLVSALKDRGVAFEPAAATELRPQVDGRVALDAATEPFDGVILALPAGVAAALLDGSRSSGAEDAAAGLRGIETASVVLVTLAYPSGAVPVPQDVSGFLVPRSEGKLTTACSLGSNKWPHWSDPDTMVLRVSAGRAGDDRALALEDDRLVARLQQELSDALGTTASPTAWRVNRWPGSFPQYTVNHLDRVADVEGLLRHALPGVVLAGASYRGSGIPACIASGRGAASELRARL